MLSTVFFGLVMIWLTPIALFGAYALYVFIKPEEEPAQTVGNQSLLPVPPDSQ